MKEWIVSCNVKYLLFLQREDESAFFGSDEEGDHDDIDEDDDDDIDEDDDDDLDDDDEDDADWESSGDFEFLGLQDGDHPLDKNGWQVFEFLKWLDGIFSCICQNAGIHYASCCFTSSVFF